MSAAACLRGHRFFRSGRIHQLRARLVACHAGHTRSAACRFRQRYYYGARIPRRPGVDTSHALDRGRLRFNDPHRPRILIFRSGAHADTEHLTLRHVTASQVRLGVVRSLQLRWLESAATLGHKARYPLQTIPRAVIRSALWSAAYSSSPQLTLRPLPSASCIRTWARQKPLSMRWCRWPTSRSSRVSSTWAPSSQCLPVRCIMAAARVLLKMARDGVVPHASDEPTRKTIPPHRCGHHRPCRPLACCGFLRIRHLRHGHLRLLWNRLPFTAFL